MTSSMSGSSGYRGPTGGNTPRPPTGFKEKAPKGYKATAMANYTPQQMELHGDLFSHVGPDSYLARLAGGDQSLFDEMEAPALRQFSELQGGLASRFSGFGGAGSLGARKSSGFQNTANAAASDFAQQLQSNRQGLMRQALNDLMQHSNMLLGQQPYETRLTEKAPKKKSGWGSLAGAGLGAAGGFLLGGPVGAYTGAQAGYGIGSSFD